MDLNFDADIGIDEDALDLEWLEQPEKMLRYGQYCASCRLQMDYAKEKVDVTWAELDNQIREDPVAFGLGKITEAVVSNTILRQPEYQKAMKAFLDAKHEYEMALAAVRAMDQRKSALERLVQLHGQEYFAGPKAPRNLTEERMARQRKTDARIGKAMKRNKR